MRLSETKPPTSAERRERHARMSKRPVTSATAITMENTPSEGAGSTRTTPRRGSRAPPRPRSARARARASRRARTCRPAPRAAWAGSGTAPRPSRRRATPLTAAMSSRRGGPGTVARSHGCVHPRPVSRDSRAPCRGALATSDRADAATTPGCRTQRGRPRSRRDRRQARIGGVLRGRGPRARRGELRRLLFALSFTTVLLLAAGFGTEELVAREVARDRCRLTTT